MPSACYSGSCRGDSVRCGRVLRRSKSDQYLFRCPPLPLKGFKSLVELGQANRAAQRAAGFGMLLPAFRPFERSKPDAGTRHRAAKTVMNTNQGTTSIDLTGWKLRDRAGGEAPLSDQLAAGASKIIILPRSLALNNNGDEVALIGNDGIERHRISYTHNQVLPGQEIHL
jgi:hypothetical protein